MEKIIAYGLIGVFLGPIASVAITPIFCLLRKIFFVPLIREKLREEAKNKGHVVQATLQKHHTIIKDSEFGPVDTMKEMGTYTYEVNGKKYKYQHITARGLHDTLTLYYIKKPSKATVGGDLGNWESPWFKFYWIIALIVAVVTIIVGLTTTNVSASNSSYDPFNPNSPIYSTNEFLGVGVEEVPTLQRNSLYQINVTGLTWQIGGSMLTDTEEHIRELINDKKIIFASHNPNIATVNAKGRLKASQIGETQIDVIYCGADDFDSSNPGSYKTTVAVKVVKNKVKLSCKKIKIKAGKCKRIKIKHYPANMLNKIRYSFANEKVLKVKKVVYPTRKQKTALVIKGLKKGKVVLKVTALGKKLGCKVVVR